VSRKHERMDWWASDESEAFRRAIDCVRRIESKDSVRREDIVRQLRLYGNTDVIGYRPEGEYHSPRHGMSLNIIRAVSDTIVAHISKQAPRPVFLTDEGNRALRRKAKLLTRFVDGVLYSSRVHIIAPRVAMDCVVFGTGMMKIYRCDDRIKMERTFPGELFVDPAESRDGSHTTLYQRKLIPKDSLQAAYHEHAGIIEMIEAPKQDFIEYYDQDDLSGMVEVVEAWKLPLSEDEPGKHIIAIEGATLLFEDWHHDRFPFVQMHWTEPMLGAWGMGVADELTGIQLEINKLLRKIQKAFHLLAVPWVFVEAGSKVQKAHLSNEIGALIPYQGTPPIVRSMDPVSPQLFAHLNWLYQRGFDHVGVSAVMAGGEQPTGATSGPGIRAAAEVQSGRFAMRIRGYEEMFLQAARWIVELGREIAEENPGFSIAAPRDRYTVTNVPWSEVDMKDDEFVLRVFPSSSLSMDPQGRLSDVTDMMNVGLIDLQQARKLLDFPDLSAQVALDSAATDSIDAMIEQILDDGIPMSPEPFMDLQLFIKRGQSYYLKALADDSAPDTHLALLRNAIEAAAAMEKAAMAEQQNMQMGLGAGDPLPDGPAGAHPAAIQGGDGMM